MYHGDSFELLMTSTIRKYLGKVQMVFTSPPFILNTKKEYGNLSGEEYIEWLSKYASILRDFLNPTGSIVIELGNAWNKGEPTMSTIAIEALLAFKKKANLHLCQEFVCFNPARLPSPAQWVNVERCRVKDAFTKVWWLSPVVRPKADNRKVLKNYSEKMKKLLKAGTYNSGRRPSNHGIGKKSFLKNNKGAIVPNVLIPSVEELVPDICEVLPISNTSSNDKYLKQCRLENIRLHPARMPMKLVEFFTEFLTEPGDIILDPFAGSNTTGYISEKFGRRWISIEAELEYIISSKLRF